ncbi:MAG: Gx transporter family protein [Ruminococcus sp.]
MKPTLKSTKHLVRMGLYTAIALTIFMVEAQIPSIAPSIPGIKLGLSNIVTLFLLTCESKRDAVMVLLVRILLGSFFVGQMMTLLYSLAGGLLSFLVMALCSTIFQKKVLWFTGIAGGVFHNIGQILAAAALMQTTAVFAYLPVLILCGMGTGLFNGLAAAFSVKHFLTLPKAKNISEKEKKT